MLFPMTLAHDQSQLVRLNEPHIRLHFPEKQKYLIPLQYQHCHMQQQWHHIQTPDKFH